MCALLGRNSFVDFRHIAVFGKLTNIHSCGIIYYNLNFWRTLMEPIRPHNTPAASRRQLQIEECLQENMLHTPYSLITVADLCRQIGISRRAFYTYYRDKDACLYALIDRMIKASFFHAMPEGKTDLLQACTVNLAYWKEHKTFLDAIVKQNMGALFRDRNVAYFTQDERVLFALLRTPDVTVDQDIISSYVAIRISMLFRWHSRGFDSDPEEMARKYIRMIQTPLLPPDCLDVTDILQNLL